jgi:thymidylate synthase
MSSFAIFKDVFKKIKTHGNIVSPRGMRCWEWEDASITFPPGVRFMNFNARKFNLDYVKREFLWYLRGDRYDTSICNYAKIWQQCVDERQQLNSNYGYYLFRRLPEERMNQTLYHGSSTLVADQDRSFAGDISWIVSELSRDRDSRRAVAVILGAEHMRDDVKDFPCTYALAFRIRRYSHLPDMAPVLNMSVHMRSQDAIYGLGSDAPCFSFIHEVVLNLLRETYPELQLGIYHHAVDSLHVYEKHFQMLETLIAAPADEFKEITAPPISGPDEAKFILKHLAYVGPGAEYMVAISESYKFASWLLDVASVK